MLESMECQRVRHDLVTEQWQLVKESKVIMIFFLTTHNSSPGAGSAFLKPRGSADTRYLAPLARKKCYGYCGGNQQYGTHRYSWNRGVNSD